MVFISLFVTTSFFLCELKGEFNQPPENYAIHQIYTLTRFCKNMWGNCCFFRVLSVFFFDFEKTAMVQKLKSMRALSPCTMWLHAMNRWFPFRKYCQICAPPTFEILLQTLVTFWFFTPMLPDKWVIVFFFFWKICFCMI